MSDSNWCPCCYNDDVNCTCSNTKPEPPTDDIFERVNRRQLAQEQFKPEPPPAQAPREFPIQPQRGVKPHPTRIPWHVADLAYSVYSAKYGRDQSLERLAERGGFGPGEMDEFLPDWREQSSAYEVLEREFAGITKDHADDWKRIQDAERERDQATLNVAEFVALIHDERARSAALVEALQTACEEMNLAYARLKIGSTAVEIEYYREQLADGLRETREALAKHKESSNE